MDDLGGPPLFLETTICSVWRCLDTFFQHNLSANDSLVVSWWRTIYIIILGKKKPPKQALSNRGIIMDRPADSPYELATSQQIA